MGLVESSSTSTETAVLPFFCANNPSYFVLKSPEATLQDRIDPFTVARIQEILDF